MADTVVAVLANHNFNVQMFYKPTEKAIEALNNSDAIIFGTYTENKNAPIELREAISRFNPIKIKGKSYFVFGSYGWSGEGIQFVDGGMKNLKMKQFDKPFSVVLTPSEDDIKQLKEYTERFCEMLEKE
jgi:flavorubredoxin